MQDGQSRVLALMACYCTPEKLSCAFGAVGASSCRRRLRPCSSRPQ